MFRGGNWNAYGSFCSLDRPGFPFDSGRAGLIACSGFSVCYCRSTVTACIRTACLPRRWLHLEDPAAMAAFFRDLERLAYALLIQKSGINDRIDRFSKLTGAIIKEDDLQAEKSPLQLTPTERAERMSQALEFAMELRRAGAKLRDE